MITVIVVGIPTQYILCILFMFSAHIHCIIQPFLLYQSEFEFGEALGALRIYFDKRNISPLGNRRDSSCLNVSKIMYAVCFYAKTPDSIFTVTEDNIFVLKNMSWTWYYNFRQIFYRRFNMIHFEILLSYWQIYIINSSVCSLKKKPQINISLVFHLSWLNLLISVSTYIFLWNCNF